MKRLLLFASSHRIGLTSLMTEQALAAAARWNGALLAVSGEKAQSQALPAKLAAGGVPHRVIPGLDDHRGLLRLAREVRLLCDEFEPDTVHVQTNWQLAIAALARRWARHRFRTVYTIHAFRHNHPLKMPIARRVIGALLALSADRVIAPSEFVKRNFAALGPKLHTLWLGVDQAFFACNAPLDPNAIHQVQPEGDWVLGLNNQLGEAAELLDFAVITRGRVFWPVSGTPTRPAYVYVPREQ